MTSVQATVLEVITEIPVNSPESATSLLQSINGLVTLAYSPESDPLNRQQSYVALSKAAMDLLQTFVPKGSGTSGVTRSIVSKACEALAVPIQLKYKFQPGKKPYPWVKATTTALNILGTSIFSIKEDKYTGENSGDLWKATIKIADGIMAADCDVSTCSYLI